MEKEYIQKHLYAGVVGHDIEISKECFGKPVLFFDGIADKEMAKTYWKLDGLAFTEGMSAPEYMKLDTLIMGGLPVCLFLKSDEIDGTLIEKFGTDLEYYPIAFMDLHFKGDGAYACSGLGVAKEYQGNGLAKHLIAAGIHIGEIDTLYIPTQESNGPAMATWSKLGIEVVSNDVFHTESDTIIFKASNLQKMNLESLI